MKSQKRNPATFPLIFAALLVLCVGQAVAYEWFYDPASTGETGFCRDCHSSFSGRGDLHDMHVGNSQFTSDCATCHFSSNGDNPKISKTGDPGNFGCVGCHGGDYGKVTGTGDPEYQAYGLRRRHVRQNGVTVCLTCHTDLSVEGLPEDIDPPFYADADSNIPPGGSCNQSPFPEDGDNPSLDPEPETAGIDIDGDGLYDMADPDCDRAVNQGMPPRVVNVRYADLSSTFNWTVLPVGGYDVIKGNLKVTLGARRFARNNDTWLSSAACASATVTPNQFVDTSVPQRGGGLYYVVRSVDTGVGTGDSDGAAQQGARDASLPGSNCP